MCLDSSFNISHAHSQLLLFLECLDLGLADLWLGSVVPLLVVTGSFSRSIFFDYDFILSQKLQEVDERFLTEIFTWLARHHLSIGQEGTHQCELSNFLHFRLTLLQPFQLLLGKLLWLLHFLHFD